MKLHTLCFLEEVLALFTKSRCSWVFLPRWGFTCEDVCEGVSAGDLERRVLGPKHIQQESSQAAQDPQETEGRNNPQQ